MIAANVAISVPKIGLLVPLWVVVPDGPNLQERVETCGRVTVAAMVRGGMVG